jgi:hypothetical protein
VNGTSSAATATPARINQQTVLLRKSYMLLVLTTATDMSAASEDTESGMLCFTDVMETRSTVLLATLLGPVGGSGCC